MSMKADIDEEFKVLIEKMPEKEHDILMCKFGIYESLDWDSAAEETVKEISNKGFEIDGNMRCYLSA